MKILGALLVAAIIGITTAVISNATSVKLNASEIQHEKAIQSLMHKTLQTSLDKHTIHLQNIEDYLRNIAKQGEYHDN